jgi:Domain of unknown function (DUF4136)
MTMSKLALLCAALFGALACFTAGCTPVVRSDANHALISSVHCGSYAWAGSFGGSSSPLRNTIANPMNEQRLREAIQGHLAPGGILPEGSAADCLVGYGIGGNYVVAPGWWGYGSWGYGWGGPCCGPFVYREGIIAVDLYDAQSRRPMWHASADQSLFDVSGPRAAQRIDEAVAAIFAKRPPGV